MSDKVRNTYFNYIQGSVASQHGVGTRGVHVTLWRVFAFRQCCTYTISSFCFKDLTVQFSQMKIAAMECFGFGLMF